MISFRCPCGKPLKAKDDAAGRRVRCPACQAIVPVPGPQKPAAGEGLVPVRVVPEGGPSPAPAAQPPQEELGGESKRCPNCLVAAPQASVICTTCGFDFRVGKLFEPPKPLLLRIPWKAVRKAAWSLACLAIVIGLGWWAYGKITSKQEEQDKSQGSTSTPADKGGPGKAVSLPQYAAAIAVRTRAVRPAPELDKDFKFQYEDGEYAPKAARDAFREKVKQEVTDILRVPGHKVLASEDEEPPKGAERLILTVTIHFGWAYQRVGGQLLPKEPYVASSTAHLYRGEGIAIWKTATPYAAPRPGEQDFTTAELEALPRLKSAKFPEVRLQDNARRTAEAVGRTLFRAILRPSDLPGILDRERSAATQAEPVLAELKEKGASPKALELVNRDNQYVIAALAKNLATLKDKALIEGIAKHAFCPELAAQAQQALDQLTAAPPKTTPTPTPTPTPPPEKKAEPGTSTSVAAIPNPDKELLKLVKTKFAAPGSFEAELRLLRAAGAKTPRLALAFARAALALEENKASQEGLRSLCAQLEKVEQPLPDDECKALLTLAEGDAPSLLGLMALRTLLGARYEGAEKLVESYLARVAAGRAPDAEPAKDGGLTGLQLALVADLAQRNAERGTEVAVALLMRAAKNQRNDLRPSIVLPASHHERIRAIRSVLTKANPEEIRNELLRAIQASTPLRPLLDSLAAAVADHAQDAKLRAVLLYALAKNAELKDPYLWRLADMLKSADDAERREAAERLRRLGEDAKLVLPELKAAIEKEKSESIRALLTAALRGAGATDADFPKPPDAKKDKPPQPAPTTKKGGKFGVSTPDVYKRKFQEW